MDSKRGAILHDTNELLQALNGHPADRAVVNTYADQLFKTSSSRLGSQINVEQSKRIITESCSNGAAFLSKYNELKSQNIRQLDPFVYLLAKIKRDPELLKTLRSICEEYAGISDAPDYESLDELQMRIQSSNTNATAGTLLHSGYLGSESDEHYQQLVDTLASIGDSQQQFPYYHADRSAAGNATTTKSKDSKPQRRRDRILFPHWMYDVPYFSADFLPASHLTAKTPSIMPLENLPLNVQERLVVQDLLACLQGCDGVYIKALKLESPHAMRNFAIDEKMHPSLMDTVNKMIPLISQHSLIERFVEEKSAYEFGRVNQAFSEALQEILQEYWKLMCQLERQYRSNQLGVSRLLLLLKETGHLFSQLTQLITNINTGDCIGGATLTLIYESLHSQVSVIGRVLDCMLYLLRSACQPFFDSLSCWIYRGVLREEDAQLGEFFISKSSNLPPPNQEHNRARDYINSAYYWDRSYSIVTSQLPTFLESHVDKILAAGKYLNVVQQCDSSQELAEPEPLVFSETEQEFLAPIDRAHAFASRTLLDFILKQKDLKGILKSIKRYFLLDQGDFIVHFMDMAANELKKPISQVSISRLNSLLEWVLQTSSAACDAYKDNLRVASTNCDLITQMLTIHVGNNVGDTIVDVDPSALEAFSLDYKVEWPTALVINRLILDRYQLLFRHLFYCRHVERHLSSSWAMRKAARRATDAGALAFNTAFILGQRMLTYIQSLQHYMTIEVIEPNWQAFYRFLDKADNLDEVLKAHEKCLEYCMDDCLLTSPDLLALVGKLNAVCIQFANCLNHLADASLDDTLDSVPMSSAASMHHLNHPRRVGMAGSSALSASPSLSNLANSSNLRRRISVASSDGGSLFRGGDNSSHSGSTLDIRRRVAASDMGSVGANEQFTIAVEHFSVKFNGLIVDLLVKIRRPMDRERDKLLSLASRLDYNGFYTRYSLEAANCDGSTYNSLAFTPGGLGGSLRPSSSMGSIATLDSTVAAPPRRLIMGDEETYPSQVPMLSTGSKQQKSGTLLPPPPQPRDRRNLPAPTNG